MVTAESLQLGPESRRLDSEPLSEQVYRVLRDAICDGVFSDHAHLVQNQLADQLQVSRTPVRDALLALAQENLVRASGAKATSSTPSPSATYSTSTRCDSPSRSRALCSRSRSSTPRTSESSKR